MKLLVLASSLVLMLSMTPSVQAASLLEDTFADGDRSSDPTWYWMTGMANDDRVDSVDAGAGTWTVGDSDLSNGNSNGYVVAYFTATTLDIGDSITLSFDFSYADAAASAGNQLRFGLFNSGGSQVSADGATSDSAFNDDAGYGSFYSLQTTEGSGGYSIRGRTGGNDTLWSASTGGLDTLLVSDDSDISAVDTTYSASFTITSTASGELTISSTINGQTIEYTDTAASTTTFDMISIYAGGANGALTLSNMSVTLIPEPSTFALLTSLGVFGFSIVRRVR
jgi:hypothetical protein